MKKLFLIFLLLIFTGEICTGETIKGSVSEVLVPKGFWGRWHVTSLMDWSNNPEMFNNISVDIWTLSGAGGVLALSNELTGANSSIKISKENIEGMKLKFTRTKEEKEGEFTVKHTETPEITLEGDIFKGSDTFIIEKYKDGKLLSKDVVKYKVVGQKLSGSE